MCRAHRRAWLPRSCTMAHACSRTATPARWPPAESERRSAAVYIAAEQGKRVHVYADETRPLLQGSRLTAWELTRAGIPVTVLVDGAAASLMARRRRRSVHRRRRSDRGERRRRQQDRHVSRSRSPPSITASRSTSPRRRSTFDPPTRERRAKSSSSSATPTKCAAASARQRLRAGVDVTIPRSTSRRPSLITAIVSDRGVHRPPYDFAQRSIREIRSRHRRRERPARPAS